MKVALLSRAAHPLHGPGGLERAVYLLARHLAARGVEPTLVTRPEDEPGAAASFPGRVLTVPYGRGGRDGHGRVLDRTLHYPAFARRAGAVVAGLVRAGAIDVVDAQGLCALGYAEARRREPGLGAPLVMNPQGMEEHKAQGWKRLALTRLRALSRRAAALADRVVATDEATRGEVSLLLGVPPHRVVVLPNGIDPDEIAALTPPRPEETVEALAPGFGTAAPLLLSVGRLEGYKGLDDVLAALAVLQDQDALPSGWAWMIAGDARDPAALDRRVPPALAGRVRRLGRVPDEVLHALYARADLFVHATRYEGSSLVTLEAMVHGLPVVATRTGGIPDKVVHGETGLLVPPGDVASLAEALRALAADGERRRAMGARGRARALEHFAWPSLIGRTIALYEELLALGARR